MMFFKSNEFKMVLCLLVIAVAVAGIMAVVNDLTFNKIEQNLANQLTESLQEVLPADSYDAIKETDTETVYEAKKEGNGIGYLVVNIEKGYGGDVKVLTGVKLDGTVSKVKILEHGETPGLGANAEKDSFISQFIGKTKGVEIVKSNADGNKISAISGATITSSAVTRAVNTAINLAEEAGK